MKVNLADFVDDFFAFVRNKSKPYTEMHTLDIYQ